SITFGRAVSDPLQKTGLTDMRSPSESRRETWYVFVAFFLFYLSVSPLTTRDMGYVPDDVRAANQVIDNLGGWVRLHPSLTPVDMPRNGAMELVFEIPFLLVGRAIGDRLVWPDRVLSIEFVLATALLVTLVFVWSRKITSNLAWSYVLSIAA